MPATSEATVYFRWTVTIILIGLAVRIGFAFANAFWLKIGLSDADGFHQFAADFAAGEVPYSFRIGWIYSYALGFVYRVTGAEVIVAYLLSTAAWLVSAVALVSIFNLLGADRRAQLVGLAIFVLLPSSVFFTTTAYREAAQLMCVTLAGAAAAQVIAGRYTYLVLLFVAGAAAGLLHGAFMPAMAILALLTLGATVTRRILTRVGAAALTVAVLAFCLYSAWMFVNYGYDLGEGLLGASDAYLRSLDSQYDARTQYANPHDGTQDLFGVAVRLFQYMMEPMPWRVEIVGDAAVLAENILRAGLIALAGWGVIANARQRPTAIVLLLSYCCLEGIWSLGTAAWGTAIRHHLPGLGLLIACAFWSWPRLGIRTSRGR